MKRIALLVLAFLVSLNSQSQIASRLASTQAPINGAGKAKNIMWIGDSLDFWRFHVSTFDSIPISFQFVTNRPTTLTGYGITDAQSYNDTNTFDLTKTSASLLYQPLGTYLKPNDTNNLHNQIANKYDVSNPANYISGINGSMVNTALGYIPYNSSNPSGYLSSITSGQVTGALGFTPYNSTNPNGYVSNLSSFSTTNLVEGTNKYYTDSRSRLAVSNGTGISYNSSTGVITNSSPDQIVTMTNGTGIGITGAYPSFTISNTALPPYVNSAVTSGTTGNAIFYLTSDKTSTGTALYSTIDYVGPIVNDATANYTYGYSVSGDKKTLTVNSKVSTGINVAVLSLTLLGVPSNVPASTPVTVIVMGH